LCLQSRVKGKWAEHGGPAAPLALREGIRESVVLYRPVGCAELRLIMNAAFSGFPPRLPHQPIFYPVLRLEYARAIARDWNTRDASSAYAGPVFMAVSTRKHTYPLTVSHELA
jgi:hypothetical protein